ncbi:ATP-binding protein [Desulfitobacterium sp. Sab5]|uniref:HAMP domain-containing sensor histidine kinase n=1 Tax=Desulfitobacterium nosdiversum TaxID=3375356 RepID=UPI003CE7C85E
MQNLVSLTQKVSQGDLKVQGVVNSEDEIGVLTKAFNQMILSLSESDREREELLQQLKEKEEMRLQLLEKLITAQEEERKRISRELHDETSQSLTSLMVNLKVLESEASFCNVGDRLREMRQVVSETLDEVHHLARDLRPSVLDDLGLVPALERYVREYGETYGIEVDFHNMGFDGERVSAPAEVALYRIIQEALTNVAKYARAQTVSVLLDWRDNWVSAIVEDDGQGFEPDTVITSPSHGLGLFGMQERATLLGGSFSIESRPGNGTTIYIKVPANSDIENCEKRDSSGKEIKNSLG